MGGLLRIGCVLEGCDYGCFAGVTGNKTAQTVAADVGSIPEGVIVRTSGPPSECSHCSVSSRDNCSQTSVLPPSILKAPWSK